MANCAIAKKLSVGRPTVFLWRDRFAKEGSAGLLTIEKGRGRKPEIEEAVISAIVKDTLYTTPSNATHWSTRTLAEKA